MSLIYPCLKQNARGTLLSLKVLPRASRNQIVGVQESSLKVKLTAPPVDGAANALCREFLAKQFGIAKSSVELTAGGSARQKTVLLHGVSCPQAHDILTRLLKEQGRA